MPVIELLMTIWALALFGLVLSFVVFVPNRDGRTVVQLVRDRLRLLRR